MRFLVTGRGSIAQRHVRHLRQLRPHAMIAVLSNGTPDSALHPCERFSHWEQALAWKPDAVIVASVSARHGAELAQVLGQALPCLAEKPLVVTRAALDEIRRAARSEEIARRVTVGCNLRYLPILRTVRQRLSMMALGRIVRAHFEVGQDLAQWRPTRGIGETYSADEAQGGGVVFDLVHEIDMAGWLAGPLKLQSAAGARLGRHRLAADDVHVALLRTESGAPVTIALDYVSRKPVRRYCLVGTGASMICDLMAKRCWIESESGVELLSESAADFDLAGTYHSQMDDWLRSIDDPAHRVASPLDDALASTALMLAMQEAAR